MVGRCWFGVPLVLKAGRVKDGLRSAVSDLLLAKDE